MYVLIVLRKEKKKKETWETEQWTASTSGSFSKVYGVTEMYWHIGFSLSFPFILISFVPNHYCILWWYFCKIFAKHSLEPDDDFSRIAWTINDAQAQKKDLRSLLYTVLICSCHQSLHRTFNILWLLIKCQISLCGSRSFLLLTFFDSSKVHFV